MKKRRTCNPTDWLVHDRAVKEYMARYDNRPSRSAPQVPTKQTEPKK